jgi:hypothetical protein
MDWRNKMIEDICVTETTYDDALEHDQIEDQFYAYAMGWA